MGAMNIGFNGRMLSFIEAFLNYRRFMVRVGGHTGTHLPQRNWSTAGVGTLAAWGWLSLQLNLIRREVFV